MPTSSKSYATALTDQLIATAEFGAVADALQLPRAKVPTICPEPANPMLVAAVWRRLGVPVLVVTPNPDSAQRIVDQLPTWSGSPDVDEDGFVNSPFCRDGWDSV